MAWGGRITCGRQEAGLDALEPEDILGTLTGPFSGASAVVRACLMFVGRSPLTGTSGDSDCGGCFGPELKFAGFDGVLFAGILENPLCVPVENGKAGLRDATHLWEEATTETKAIVKPELGRKVQIACIGPGGETLSLICWVVHDIGRSSFGPVMGSRKLKAIAVKGDMRVPIADEAKLRGLRKKYPSQLKVSEGGKTRKEYGTCAFPAGLRRQATRP